MKSTSEEELTKLAVDSLLKDAKKFNNRREMEFRATQQRQATPLNKSFLKNLLTNNNSHNRRVDNKQKSVDFSKYKSRMKFLGKNSGQSTSYLTKEQQDKHDRDRNVSNDEKDVIEISDSDTTDERKSKKRKRKKLKKKSKRHKKQSSSSSSDSDRKSKPKSYSIDSSSSEHSRSRSREAYSISSSSESDSKNKGLPR